MKKQILAILFITLLLASCAKVESGQLTGILERPTWKPIQPYGMQYIPSGSLHIGPSDQDVNSSLVQRPKQISIQGFFMDDTEITNNEYRQFVSWVRDSIAHIQLGHTRDYPGGIQGVDWEQELDYSAGGELDGMFYQGDEQFGSSRNLDIRQLVFDYQWYDWKGAAQDFSWSDDYNRHSKEKHNRSDYIKKDATRIYPDTLVWIRDFSYSYNEPMTRNYFWHPAFDDYPVVGIAWKQANAFSYWRTNLWNNFEEVNTEDFRLPTEHEWEYASRGGHDMAPYPWGGYYVRNAKGCLLANFKPGRGDYPADGGLYTVRADAYFPNDYGLFNMSGNVSEWTSSAYYENAYAFLHDLQPDIRFDAQDEDPTAWKRKVIRGGSWKDIMYYIQTGTRHWEFQDTTKSYIGFRNVLTFLGRSMNDFN
ncbi:MAG: SUMF1/EgtB/PvdO family nonheme iron enzyme [Aureispira sp.]|nr:SUMF1/EgtB/PvdO family nonheme iron enzyme [Aureispira sp.]